jgi:hypothetical protein
VIDDSQALVPVGPLQAVAGQQYDPEFLGKAFAALVGEFFEKGGAGQIVKAPKTAPQSVFLDPWEILGFQGSRQKRTTLTFEILREMARACKPVAAVIATRQNQAARFCRLPRFRGDVGFSVRMRDKEEKAGPAAKKRIRELEKFVMGMGWESAVDPNGMGKRPGFEAMIRMIVRDSLALDAIAIEPRRSIRGDIYDLWPVDAATIRFAGKNYERKLDKTPPGVPIAYVQEYMGQILTEYPSSGLAYAIRNPRTDIQTNGYGYSELEILIETVTSILNADSYNSRYFTQNSLPEGVLSIVGNLSQTNLAAFQRHWNSQVSGVMNAWKVPVVATPDGKGVTFTPFKLSNREMQFHEYTDFLIDVTCAIYQCNRQEIGFSSKRMGESGTLGGGSDEPQIEQSQSKGFYPLMTFIEGVFNENVIWEIDEEFMFAWDGVDQDREVAQWKMKKEQLESGVMTPRMYWREYDYEDPYPHMMWPDCPPNSTLEQVYIQESGLMNMGDGEEDDQGDDQQDGDQPQDDGDQDQEE